MLEKNSLIFPGKSSRRKRVLESRTDPHAELTSAFINQAIPFADGTYHEPSMPEAGAVINSKDWMENKNH